MDAAFSAGDTITVQRAPDPTEIPLKDNLALTMVYGVDTAGMV